MISKLFFLSCRSVCELAFDILKKNALELMKATRTRLGENKKKNK